MKFTSFDALIKALDTGGVRYLIAGGLAVNAYGYLRFTRDVDVVIQMLPDNIGRAFSALNRIGYSPVVPVTAEQFADASQRERRICDKGMKVLQFWSDAHRETPVDMFVIEPFDFEQEYGVSLDKPLGDIHVRFVSIPTLIRMKETAGRPQDKLDIEELRLLHPDHGR
ncbi:MAG: hypothetical protein Q8M53_17620 [Burkholderiales bacterium]|nr:hypothetical protein [Burkholderiales bacterium]